jgi:hypothetical protein
MMIIITALNAGCGDINNLWNSGCLLQQQALFCNHCAARWMGWQPPQQLQPLAMP